MANKLTPDEAMKLLTRRYMAEPSALIAVLCPLLIPIRTLDKKIFIADGTTHARASFTVNVTSENAVVLVRGRTGKFVPASYGSGEPGWREIAKSMNCTLLLRYVNQGSNSMALLQAYSGDILLN